MVNTNRVKDVILGTLFSVALLALISRGIDWSSEKCPFDTDNTKLVIYALILATTFYILFWRDNKSK